MLFKKIESAEELGDFLFNLQGKPRSSSMSNTITFHRINDIQLTDIELTDKMRIVNEVDMLVDGLVHTITAGDFVNDILVDGDNVYFWKDDFYTIPNARIYNDRLRYSFALAD